MEQEVFLPRASEARIPEDKLKGYVLNPDHPTGRHKARMFRSALGIEQDDWEYLRDQILERLPDCPVAAIRLEPWGRLYEVRMTIDGLNGESHRVLTAWALEGDKPPSLATLYVLPA